MNHKQLSQTANLVNSFLNAALWADSPDDEQWDNTMLSQEIFDAAYDFCQKFLDKCKEKNLHWHFTPENIDQVGHDLYLTVNEHGAGFWDGDWNDDYDDKNTVGDMLTAICEEMGMFEIYMGDDDLIYSI